MRLYNKLISLFSGAGGLDLGFQQAGFEIIWANENDKTIWETYKHNHPKTFLDTRSITDIKNSEIPECDGIIGGPPCQSWSLAGSKKGKRGISDKRGKLIYEYLRIVKTKKPSFFVFENVAGIMSPSNQKEFAKFREKLENLDYKVAYQNLNARDYGVPQDRKRVFLVGIKKALKSNFYFNKINKIKKSVSLRDCVYDLQSIDFNSNQIANHEYYEGSFSPLYMSRNRVRSWQEVSFTIQASGRHSPLHPSAFPMVKKSTDCFVFAKINIRRLTVRECARIQTFPDNFIFKYKNLNDGYKMVGNAVPVLLAYKIASELKITLEIKEKQKIKALKETIITPRLNSIYENNSLC